MIYPLRKGGNHQHNRGVLDINIIGMYWTSTPEQELYRSKEKQ